MSQTLSNPPAARATTGAAPAAAPVPFVATNPIREYRIGEEDLLEIKVFGVDPLSSTVRVNPRGQVTLPLIGTIALAGLTAQQAEATVAAKLAESYMQNPQVSVFIKEFTTQRVTIEGAVTRPGVYPLRGQSTLLTSLAMAGGPARMAELTEVILFRDIGAGRRVATRHDVNRIRVGEIDDPPVFNDDLIVVNRTGARVVLRDSLFGDLVDTINPLRWAPGP